MSESILHKIVIFLTVVLFGVGLYFYATTDRNIYTAIFLRAGSVFLLASCFWKWILRLPSWAQIGWLPIIAAIVAWRPFLLKFAIPTSVVLVFLNSPLARGSYRKKNWHDLSNAFSGPAPTPSQPETNSGTNTESNPGSQSESEHKTVVEVLTEHESKPESKPESRPEPEPKPKEQRPLYGPNAQNTMFRALSRVAGRQVGKMMKKKEKK